MTSGLELHEAASVGDYDLLEDYLKSGKYDVNMEDPEWKNKTALHWAASKGYVDCIRLLLENGAKGTAKMDMDWTPAHCAAEAGKLTVIRALHNAAVPIDRKDKYGDTPRKVAETYGHTELVNFLILAEEEQSMNRLMNEEIDDNSQSDDDEEDDKQEYKSESSTSSRSKQKKK